MNRMVTKGYQKGVYERVTKGIGGESYWITRLRKAKAQIRAHVIPAGTQKTI